MAGRTHPRPAHRRARPRLNCSELDEGVVQAVQDLDLCMILGAGWPFWLGGISGYLDRAGVSEKVTGSRFLPRGVASLPA